MKTSLPWAKRVEQSLAFRLVFLFSGAGSLCYVAQILSGH